MASHYGYAERGRLMSIDELVGVMKGHGLRITPQRVEVLKLLLELSHPTADQIYARMQKLFPYMSQATVYNTLKALKDLGLIAEITDDQRSHRYEFASKDHCHFTCKRCGEIHDIDAGDYWQAAREIPKRRGGYLVEGCRIELFGTCPRCAAE